MSQSRKASAADFEEGKSATSSGKIEKPNEQVRTAPEFLASLRHLQMDFETFQRNALIEISTATENAILRMVAELISVLDEIDRAVSEEKARKPRSEATMESFLKVKEKLYDVLEKEGLSKIEALGKPFDPQKHEVISKVESEIVKEGTIVEEIRAGYTFRGQVIRPSSVRISAYPESLKKIKQQQQQQQKEKRWGSEIPA